MSENNSNNPISNSAAVSVRVDLARLASARYGTSEFVEILDEAKDKIEQEIFVLYHRIHEGDDEQSQENR